MCTEWLNRIRDKISRKKFLRFFCLTPEGKKKLEIVPRNLEFSDVFPDEQSRDLCFLRNVNIEILKSIGRALCSHFLEEKAT